jgi:16S rRNA (guanine1516-N2)-methyltransferase
MKRLEERGFALESVDSDDTAPGEASEAEQNKFGKKLVLRDLTDSSMTPLEVDFSSNAILHRLRHGLSKNQSLGKALGLKSVNPETAPFVFDATAGLGTDALVMAALGCRVRAVERSEVIFALLNDGERRLQAATDPQLVEIAKRLSFENGDARAILSGLSEEERPDVVYLDPMYPEEGRSKSALPKKTMQMFRRLLDGDEDAEELWQAAMKAARARVVVKRPLKAPALGNVKPTHTFEGKTARFDMYLRPQQP